MDARRVPIALLAVLTVGLGARFPATARAQQPAPASAKAEAPAVRVVPYGIVFFNLFANDSATNNADVPLWAAAGPGSVSATGRQSRFGLRVTGPVLGTAKVSAVLEADFYGGFPGVGVGDNMGVLRLRLANARLDWKRSSLVVGQDWMVFAPVNPLSIASTGIPLLAAAGNPWSRLPQVRGEWRSPSLLLQGALLAPSTGDFNSAFLYQPGSGALSQVPFLQGRAAYTIGSVAGLGKPATLGVSGHYGRSRVLTPIDRDVDSRGVAVDWSVPLGANVSLSGEAFAGRNLAAFQAGVFQRITADGAVLGGSGLVVDGPRAVGSRGGWTQAVATITKTIEAHVAFGIDDPKDGDFLAATPREARVRNTAASAGFQHKASNQITWGLEYRHIVTSLLVAGRKTDNHINLAVTFAF